MDHALEAVAEQLANEFPDEPSATVIRVVTASVEEFPDGDELFIEQAARAYLSAGSRHVRGLAAADHRRGPAPQRRPAGWSPCR